MKLKLTSDWSQIIFFMKQISNKMLLVVVSNLLIHFLMVTLSDGNMEGQARGLEMMKLTSRFLLPQGTLKCFITKVTG